MFVAHSRLLIRWAATLLMATSPAFQIDRAAAFDEPIQFNRDIRPILSDACFQCHGPDARQRQADLRLDNDEQLFAERDGHRVLVPGDPSKSELYRRLTATNDDEHMPPPNSGKRLTAQQIATIRRWIERGAKWQGHWAFVPPTRPASPKIRDPIPARRDEIRNSIDRFVLARLDRDGLQPSPEAVRATLLRRVTLDLTGLPPSPDEIDEFLADSSPDAYDRVVDRLLASPRFGEKLARPWLDGARYADTSGYQSDGERIMWRWRDWVIDAFNDNKPFDEFTIEQLAGDLLPNATLDQILATGFNRNHRGNAEGGIIPEEYAVEYVVDRVDTTATVWLGLTLGCCRCHDHKFDPFSQREYYQLYSFFNNVPEKGRAIKFGNSPPFVKTPTREQQSELQSFSRRIERAITELEARRQRYPYDAASVRERAAKKDWSNWTIIRGRTLHIPLDSNLQAKARESAEPVLGHFDGPAPRFATGKLHKGLAFDGQHQVTIGDVANIGFYDRFSISAWVFAEAESGTILSRMTDDANADGYNLCLDHGKLQLNLCKRWLDDALRVETQYILPTKRWVHVVVTYDGSRFADGVQFYIDGLAVPKRIVLDELNQPFASKSPFRLGSGGFTPDFRGVIDEVTLFDVVLAIDEIAVLAMSETIPELLVELEQVQKSKPPSNNENRSLIRNRKIHYAYSTALSHPDVTDAYALLVDLHRQQARLIDSFPTTMVMQELPALRETKILIRGAYDRPGERVSPAVPQAIQGGLRLGKSGRSVREIIEEKREELDEKPKADADSPFANRLDFARWLADPGHPLTARVTVNRFWQQLFGQGLVKTVDDFGSQGDWPTHLELLDWLAVEFSESRALKSEIANLKSHISNSSHTWDIKRLVRLIVTSATYRQSSRASAGLIARDPENRLLARGPRTRLSAEMVRDQALAASGLLTEQLGGPSIKPYQPEGLWDDLQSTEKYVQDHGPALYRRGLYVFWKRTIAPPVMVTFDAAGRETCIVRETRTNTPLQALTLLNEVSFVEAARNLAERVLRDGGSDIDARLRFAFHAVLTRKPTERERTVLRRGLEQHLTHYRQHPAEATKVLATGESPADSNLDPAEVAAWAAIGGLILNLDEAVTKE